MWKLTLGCIEQWGWSSCMRVLKRMSSFAPLENMDFVCFLELFLEGETNTHYWFPTIEIVTANYWFLQLSHPIRIYNCNLSAIWVMGDMLAWFSRPVVPGCGAAAVHKAIKRMQLIPLSPLLLLHLSCLSPLILNPNAVSIAHLFRCSAVA